MHESSRVIEVPFHRRIISLLRESMWLIRPMLIFVALLLLSFVTWIVYNRIGSNTYLGQVNSAIIGSLTTVFLSFVVAILAFWNRLNKMREYKRIERLRSSTFDNYCLRLGALEIPDVIMVSSSWYRREWTESAHMQWLPILQEPRETPEYVRAEIDRVLPGIREDAAKKHIPFHNSPCLDLRKANIDIRTDLDGSRKPCFYLTPGVAYYEDFVASSLRIDEVFKGPDGKDTTLKEQWDIRFTNIQDVEYLPVMAKVGCQTAVVTSDNQLVVGIRGRTIVAGNIPTGHPHSRKKVHFMAAGMIPTDVDSTGLISPKVASQRTVKEEINVGQSSDCPGRILKHVATGFYFDTSRLQPCFTYLAFIDLTWNELQTYAPSAKDFWEVEGIFNIPFDLNNIELRRLFLGLHDRYVLASNHAAMVLWFSSVYQFGFDAMNQVLSLPTPLKRNISRPF